MIKLKKLMQELDYPIAGKGELQSYEGTEGWKGKVVWMSPDKFLNLCHPLPDREKNNTSSQNLEYRMKNGLPIDFLVLIVDMNKKKVVGHEGRHRATVAKKLGIEKVPVLIFTGSNFKRVPQWSPEDHTEIDKSEFKPEYDKTLNESDQQHPSVILGAITQDNDILAVKGYTDYAKHPGEWARHKHWRYVPEIKMLGWWETPNETEETMVKDYLTSKGYPVKLHYTYGYTMKENKSGGGYPGDIVVGKVELNGGTVVSKTGNQYNHSHLPRSSGWSKSWRYNDLYKTIYWWSDPNELERETVTDYLNNNGYTVKYNLNLDDMSGESYNTAYNKAHGLMENKELVMEGTKAKDVESFLRDAIKGSEWEGKVFAVGGFTRDEIMGKTPKDLDVVVEKQQGGIEFTIWLAKKIGNYKEGSNPVIFPAFGTAKMVLDGVVYNGVDLAGEDLEAVMPRSEQYHDSTSRKPTDVQFSDLLGDAKRRDLSINAIYKNISTGEFIDPIGGIEDIKNKIVRPPSDPDLIYTDDALRMFRVIRFANRFGWELTPAVVQGIKRNLHRLHNTSKERIRDELNKILQSDTPDRGIRMLKDTGLLPYIAKELQQAVGMTQNKWHSEDVFDHTMTVLSKTKPNLINRIGALLHDIGKTTTKTVVDNEVHFYSHESVGADMAREILTALKYPNDIIDPVVLAIKNHMRLKQSGKEGEKISDKALRKFVVDMGEHLEDIMDVIHSDNISHASASSMPNQIPNLLKRIEQLRSTIPTKNQKLPVTGDDLQQLGLKPGPLYKELLDLVRDTQLENPNTTKDEYLIIIKSHLNGKI